MIVIDASAFIALFGAGDETELVAALGHSGHWVVPEHFRGEVLNGLRGLWLGRKIDDDDFDRAARLVEKRPVDVRPIAPLIPRIRELAANANVYDAAYIALAEQLGCSLVTVDAKYDGIPGILCPVVVPRRPRVVSAPSPSAGGLPR